MPTWWTLSLDNCTFEKLDSRILDTYPVVAVNNSRTIIVDSGTTYVLMNSDDRKKLLDHLYYDREIFCHNEFIPKCYCDGT